MGKTKYAYDPRKNSADLGKFEPTFSKSTQWRCCFVQIAHRGQDVSCPMPHFRVCGFAFNKEEEKRMKKVLEAKLKGTGKLYRVGFGTPLIICEKLEDQANRDHLLGKVKKLKDQYMDSVRLRDEDFKLNRNFRTEGNQEKAAELHRTYVAKYNKLGWVKAMRKFLDIHPKVEVIPGMHHEAMTDSERLKREDAETNEIDDQEQIASAVDDDDDDDDDVATEAATESVEDIEMTMDQQEKLRNYPDSARTNGQKLVSFSYVIDDDDSIETLVMIHAVFNTKEDAQQTVISDLNNALYPIDIATTDMYTWVSVAGISWNNTKMSQYAPDLEESWSKMDAQAKQDDRYKGAMEKREMVREARKKKDMDDSVRERMCEKLGLDREDFDLIMDDPETGTDKLIELVKIQDDTERRVQVRQVLHSVKNSESSSGNSVQDNNDASVSPSEETTPTKANPNPGKADNTD